MTRTARQGHRSRAERRERRSLGPAVTASDVAVPTTTPALSAANPSVES
ncbi:MAG: hypothetical protein ACK5LN_07260 [Propioniciclava sp.]